MKYHKKLLNVVIILAILAAGQLIDYMLAGQKIFKTISGTVTDVKKSIVFGTGKRTRNIYYTKTVIRIGDKMKRFYAKAQTDADSLLQQLQQGDKVEISVRSWYQPVSYMGTGANMFLVKKNRKVIYDITVECKKSSKMYMLIFGAMALFFYVIYLDVVKKVSLENWFQKKILKNTAYLNRNKRNN